jgi:hypothetical protein
VLSRSYSETQCCAPEPRINGSVFQILATKRYQIGGWS